MAEYRRAQHRRIATVLAALNKPFLEQAHCYFGGGTRLALAFDEYRESQDIDFLCADRVGFRRIRETITQSSLGELLRRPMPLAREVRADRDAVRTFFLVEDARIKFEIIHEARIELARENNSEFDAGFDLPALSVVHTVAEKLLANADRGIDVSTFSRDLIDLAWCIQHATRTQVLAAITCAEQAYGATVQAQLRAALAQFRRDRAYAQRCLNALGVEDLPKLRRGLRMLSTLLRAWPTRSTTPRR